MLCLYINNVDDCLAKSICKVIPVGLIKESILLYLTKDGPKVRKLNLIVI